MQKQALHSPLRAILTSVRSVVTAVTASTRNNKANTKTVDWIYRCLALDCFILGGLPAEYAEYTVYAEYVESHD